MSHEGQEASRVESVADLIDVVELEGVRFYRLHAEIDESEEPETADEVPDGSEPVAVNFNFAFRHREGGLDYRLNVSVPRSGGTFEADAAVIYSFKEPVKLAAEAILDFGDNIALMVLYPYVRQAISDLGQRLGAVVNLPLLQRGELRFSRPEDGLQGSRVTEEGGSSSE